ncbi:4146_t:CDS:2 [Entrophospora sp. SA101]|nr:4146_t:CDS:2 [Entrophospora sp. SA101]
MNSQDPDPMNIHDAIQFISNAWNNVNENMIKSSWKRSGTLPNNDLFFEDNFNDNNLESDLNELTSVIEQLSGPGSIEADEYVSIDQQVDFEEEMSMEKIKNITEEKVSNSDSLESVNKVLNFIQQNDLSVDSQLVRGLHKVKRNIMLINFNNAKQTDINEYIDRN